MKSAELITSSTERQTWNTTMDFPVRPFLRLVTVAAFSFKEELTSMRVACQAGANPKSRPVSKDAAAANAKTPPSKRVTNGEGPHEVANPRGIAWRPRHAGT